MADKKSSYLQTLCNQGALHPEEWVDKFIEVIANPKWDNRDLLHMTRQASSGLDVSLKTEWFDNLLEFSLWETGSNPERLGLCDYLFRNGLARFDSPERWNKYGGLLHVACEGGNLEAISWAFERDPLAIYRYGGSLQLSVFHALCINADLKTALNGFVYLQERGGKASAVSRDGRSALFRCHNDQLAELFLEAGADPWVTDRDGFNAFGYWLELGYWRCATQALRHAPKQANVFQPWGSFIGGHQVKEPFMDRALFILATGRGLVRPHDDKDRPEALSAMMELGCDPSLRDRHGRSLYERVHEPSWRALIEQALLCAKIQDKEGQGSPVRL